MFADGIDASKTVYAKWIDEFTLTFDSQGGSAVAPKKVGSGLAITKPEDPVLEGSSFAGWYEEEGCTTPFVFADGITADKTVYAKWVSTKTVTLNYNYAGAPANKEVEVSTGGKMTAPVASQPGYYLDGWYTLAEGGDEIDFSTYTVDADVTLYAHWEAPTTFYRFTAQLEKKRIAFRYSGSSDYLNINPVKGDVITFKYRVPEGKNFDRLYFRNYNGDSSTKLADGGSSSLSVATVSGPDANGWYSFSVTFGDLQSGSSAPYPFSGFLLELIYTGYFVEGDKIDVLGFAYNGEELVIYNDYHKGIRTTETDGAGDDTKPLMEKRYVSNGELVTE